MSINKVKINESVSLLFEFNPTLIEELKKEFPNHKSILKRGIILGEEEEKLVAKIRDFIANNEIKDAIEEFKHTGYFRNEIAIQEANLKEIDSKYQNSLIDYDEFNKHTNKVRHALLNIGTKIIEESELNGVESDFERRVLKQDDETTKENELRLKVVKSSLELIISKCDTFIPRLKRKLKMLNGVQLISQIVIAISGASLLTLLSTEVDKSINYLIGFLTLIGSLLTIYVQSKSIAINPNSNSVFKIYEDLVNLHIDAEQ